MRPDSYELGRALLKVWMQAAANHRTHSATGSRESDIHFLALGLSGEAGELANFVKKRWRDGDGHDQAIKYEVADVCAYAFMLANEMGMCPSDLIATIAEKQRVFLEKMAARAGDATTKVISYCDGTTVAVNRVSEAASVCAPSSAPVDRFAGGGKAISEPDQSHDSCELPKMASNALFAKSQSA